MKAFFLKHQSLRRIAFFFPFQLVMVHLKKNHLLLLFWLIFFGFVTEALAPKYGIPLLFLNPEYLDNVSFWSYLIIGFSCGGFIMAYNISSYIMNGFRFPFLATLSNPFLKYCLNNSIIPGSFLLIYIIKIILFQHKNLTHPSEILILITGFFTGIFIFLFLSITYFFSKSKDIFRMFGLKNNGDNDRHFVDIAKKEERDWHVETYLTNFTKIRLARRYDHYEKQMLRKVFKQNHYTAATFEILVVISLLLLGFYRETPMFMIPAGASLFLLFTMFLMLTSAMHTWLRGWSTTAFLGIIFFVNMLFQFQLFDTRNKAFGLNYEAPKADFSYEHLKNYHADSIMRKKDIRGTLEILNKWKRKNSVNTDDQEKPKLVLVNTSGGGLRSTLWTFHALQYTDSVLHGQLMKHTALITGSSGGMIGAAYIRELYLQQQQKRINSYYDNAQLRNISKDLLNPIAFSIAVNDLFFRFQHFNDGKNIYTKDRAYAFESKLNENTGYVFNKKLKDYREPEKNALIPMMILTPTIINDGKKLLISPQPLSYMIHKNPDNDISYKSLYNSIEFSRFFEGQEADELRFTSALRMNASFPYIMPVVSLPSEPTIEVMDAGIRDNYGIETSIKFLHTFKDWVEQNTSGIIIIQIRDRYKESPIEENPLQTITGSLSRPLGTFYGNTFLVQDYNQTQLLEYVSHWFNGPIDVIDFQLKNEEQDNISLSWHLTEYEKNKILGSIKLKDNQEAIKKLNELLKGKSEEVLANSKK